MWQGDDICIYENLRQQAIESDKEIPEFVKEIIQDELLRRKTDNLK